ncbi:MAG: type VI secretion system tip protein VgrG [Deltaproteobacteria bacterium]|nr:type VI secretion system tip protein VgrG [Deltaproteobacteria bacterium]
MVQRLLHASLATQSVRSHRIAAFRVEQRLGRPAQASITALLDEEPDLEQLVGEQAAFEFCSTAAGPPYVVAGLIEAVTALGSSAAGDTGAHYARLRLVSHLQLLARTRGSEIHQERDVQAIVADVLARHGIGPEMQDWRLSGSYAVREYCVRYEESALCFVLRLLEEEGIWCRSVYREGQGEVLVFEDDSSLAEPIAGDARLPFRPAAALASDEDAVFAVAEQSRVCSGRYVLRDFDFRRPRLDTTVAAAADADADLEVYDYPGRYDEPALGERRARVRLEAEQALRAGLVIESSCGRLEAGRRCEIADGLHASIDGKYFVTAVVHELVATPGAEATGEGEYVVRAALLPGAAPFRAPLVTPWPVVAGPQTARIVAPPGSQSEYIHTDEHGRVKVKFHWDPSDVEDDRASCWMRVGQLQTSGSMVLPRVDWEVVVEFLEGSPDRPIVTGRLYNGIYMPPYALPQGRTRTALQSASTPGGGGRNEIRFEDRAGAEEISINAQYDQMIATANNKLKTVGNCETLTVGAADSLSVGANESVAVTKGWQHTVVADQSLEVGGNRDVKVNAVHALGVTGSSSTSVGGNHLEMDGNPLEALLQLAVEMAVKKAVDAVGDKIDAVTAAMKDKLDQSLGALGDVAGQVEELGGQMEALAGGDLSAAAPLLAGAAGLPMPGAVADALSAGSPGPQAGAGGAGGGDGGDGGGGGGPSAVAMVARGLVDDLVGSAVKQGVGLARDGLGKLGKALGLDAAGGGGKSEDNVAGPEGSVAGVDATDRAKGPGHWLAKVGGNQTDKIGAVLARATVEDVNTNVAGSLSQSIGAARVELVWGNRAEVVGGLKNESAVGLVVVSRGDESETVGAAKTQMVGGAVLEKIAGAHNIEAGGPATFIGAFHKIEAGTSITFKCGLSEVVVDGGGVTLQSPLIAITAGKIQLAKIVSEAPGAGAGAPPAPAAPAPGAPGDAAAGTAASGAGPGAPAAGGAAGVSTGLGNDVDALASKSPSLTKDMQDLQKDGWKVQYGTAGKGSYADRGSKTIVVDENEKGNPAALTQTLAHEAGHAKYGEQPYVPHAGMSKADYVQRNTDRHLDDEGAATIANARARQEILDAGGQDIGVAGAGQKGYVGTYDDMRAGKLTEDQARRQIGQQFAGGEHTSTTGESYGDYYGKPYGDFYDKQAAAGGP